MTRAQRALFPGHWAWAIPILLIVASLSIRQIDLYSPSSDEEYSISAAGFASGGHSLPEVSQFVLDYPDAQTPGYFFLLNLWGNFASSDIAVLRVFSIFTGLLALATAYRLGFDYIDPRAGMILLVLVACNAYFNYTYIQMRMYSCVVLASGIAVWLYMRVTVNYRGTTVKRWLAAIAAIFALLMFHVLSTLFLLVALFGCHVIFVRKDRSWFAFPMAVACALALASPYLASVMNHLLASSIIDRAAQNTLSMSLILPIEFARAGLSVVLNSSYGAGQIALTALALAGIALSLADGRTRHPQVRMHLIALLGLITLLSCVSVGLVTTERMRYAAALLLPFLFVIAAGLSALARRRNWMIILVVLYVIAGNSHHSSGNSDLYVTYGWRRAITQAPLHAISRLALQDESRPLVIGYQQTPHWINVGMPDYGYGRLQERLFVRHGIQLEVVFESKEAADFISATTTPNIWTFYQSSALPSDLDTLESYMREHGFQLRQIVETGKDTVIRQYSR